MPPRDPCTTGAADPGRPSLEKRAPTVVARSFGVAGRGLMFAMTSLLSASLVPPTDAAASPAHRAREEGPTHRPIPGALSRMRLEADRQQIYYVYVPRLVMPGAPLVVAVHGISRNAREHAHELALYAEQYGAVLVAPLFDEARFPDYQRLGRPARGQRADRMLDAIVAEVGRTTGADVRKLYLFGFSGGGQFVHRYAMAYPERVASYVVGAAGWYTFPDETLSYPRGTDTGGCFHDVCFEPQRYLQVPALVLVGERDVHEGAAMRHGARVNEQQGDSRFERGERWIEAMSAAARDHGFDTRFEFASLPRSGHSFTRAAKRGGIGQRAFAWFFGPVPPGVALPPSRPDRMRSDADGLASLH